jgi:hypothetical protein
MSVDIVSFAFAKQVSLQDFHAYLEVQASRFSERVFSALDLDASGRLDFREFLVGIW